MSGLLEREPLLGRIRGLMAAAVAGEGARLLLEGEAGIGKTSLLDEATSLAAAAGVRVLRAAGHPLESSLTWGVVRQLIEPALGELSDEERRQLGRGQGRRALEVLDGRGDPAGVDELELVHAAYRLVTDLTDARPAALVVVDDLQWADRSSVMFLLYLAQRLGRISLLGSVRTGEPPAAPDLVQRLLAESTAATVPVPALTAAGCAALIAERFPEASPAFHAEALRVTGGNPLLLVELLDAVAADGGLADDGAAAALHQVSSVSLRRTTTLRLAPTGEAGRRLAEALAVLEPGAVLHRAAALAELPLADAVTAADALHRVGVLVRTDPPQFAHPLVQAAVRADIPEAELGLRHARAAASAYRDGVALELVAAHLLHATPTGDPEVVSMLRGAAAAARLAASVDSARRYLERALREPPPPELRAQVMAELAEAEVLDGREEGLARLDAALAAADGTGDVALLIRIGDVLFQSGRYVDAAGIFDRALAHGGEADAELVARLRACRLAMETLRPGGHVSDELDGDEAEATGGRFLMVHLGLASVMGIDDHRRTRELTLAGLGDGALLREQGVRLDLLIALGCLVWADAFEECEATIGDALDVADERASHLGRAHLLFGRSWIRYWSGRLEAAVADAREAIEPWRGGWNGQIHFARFWCASALVELGRYGEAQAVLDAPDGAGLDVDVPGVTTLELARAKLATAQGDHGTALEHLRRSSEAARTLPFVANPTVLPWRSETALGLRAVGDEEGARRWSEDELTLARQYGAPRPLGVALRAHGLVLGGNAGLALLEESVSVLEGSPAALELARARIDLGAALRRAGRRPAARDLLRQGLDDARAMGAVRLQGQARAELVAAGARPRRDATSGPAALTPAELRVCELAVQGRSNPEIAAELFLSRRTVEFHLGNAFRKLGGVRREDLRHALGETS